VSAPAKGKKRSRKPPLRLTDAEVAAIDELMKLRHQQNQWEVEDQVGQDEEQRQRLLHSDHSAEPWPGRLKPGTVSGIGDYIYAREEVPAKPDWIEVARRDGMVRYVPKALLARDEINLDDYWRKRDPSLHFVMSRLKGVSVNDWDRKIDEALKDLLDTDIPPSQDIKQLIKARYQPVPKQRERDQDRALASVINAEVEWLTELLADAGYTDAKTRADACAALHWRKVVHQDRGRWRFLSGEALAAWMRRHRDPTKSTSKMSCARRRSRRDE
jgi:hypothetical protein